MPQALRITYRISADKLEELASQESEPRVRVRLLAMRLVKLRHPATAAAESLGLGLSQTCVWVKRFNQSGPAGLHDKKRAPRRSRLAVDQVEAFKARVRQGARPEDGVSVLRGPDFHRILRQEFHAPVSLGGTYYILHKLDFSSLMPRPQHQQSDPVAQAAFKKKAALAD
jgi:transposase